MTLREEQKLYEEACMIAKDYAGFSGVSDIEFGIKHRLGRLTNEYSLRFKVKEKKSPDQISSEDMIPEKIGIFRTDVLNDKITLQKNIIDSDQKQARIADKNNLIRPLSGGLRIQSGIFRDTENYWATVGFFYPYNDLILGFTNYHALYADLKPNLVRDEYTGRLPVFQNFNDSENRIGVAFDLYDKSLDYATFILEKPLDLNQSIIGIEGQLASYIFPQINMPLIKSGAGTGITYGIIDGRSCLNRSEISIHLDTRYHNSYDAVSAGGDSGALWILNDGTNVLKPVALHYGGGETRQWAKAKPLSSIFASVRNKKDYNNS